MIRMLPFVLQWRGKTCNFAGGLGGQCVDLVNQYIVDVWRQTPHQLNAIDWQHVAIPGMRWEQNTPSNAPPAGSLVIWGPFANEDIGAFGHIAVAVYAEVMQLLTFDQNWPDGSPCSLVIHDYGGVIGWLRPSG